MVELVQLERLAQVRAHGGERVPQVAGGVAAEFELGEGQLVVGGAQPLVGGDEGRIGAAAEFGVVRSELGALLLAGAPESGHGTILRRCPAARAGVGAVSRRFVRPYTAHAKVTTA